MPEIKLNKKLIYAGDAHRAILQEDPKLAYCIEQIKAVDAVEVVRCKDCIHRKERVCFNPSAGMWVGVELKDNDFCSYGERKDNET